MNKVNKKILNLDILLGDNIIRIIQLKKIQPETQEQKKKPVKMKKTETNKNKTLVQILNITKSFENRDLIGIKIGKEQAIKPSFFIDAGIHAREWIAPATAIYIINEVKNNN